MIEIPTLAVDAFRYSLPFLIAAGEGFATGIGFDLWLKIKEVFTRKKEDQVIELLEKSPNDSKLLGRAEYILESELKGSPELIASFTSLIEAVKTSNEYKNIVTQTGDNNIAVTGISNSKINIKKGQV